ncbi:MAG: hypothetical protein G01um101429_212 [Parcubacteria group bacterium Gr01-1014_29]|nr:MAG: hypothetical protein G01um101429_212 [Parcubacteria group bacterium Gr01-1014_29]
MCRCSSRQKGEARSDVVGAAAVDLPATAKAHVAQLVEQLHGKE